MIDGALVIGGIVSATAVAAAAAYAHLSGGDVEVDVDPDNDGETEASFDFERGEDPDGEHATSIEPPLPESVQEIDALEDIKGIGPTRAERLSEAGFESAEDIYYASDASLEDVKGIGPTAVEQMREDVGSVEAAGNESDGSPESAEQDQSESASTDETAQNSDTDTSNESDTQSTEG